MNSMQAAIANILDALKNNKLTSVLSGIFLFALLAFSNNPVAMETFPEGWRVPMKNVFDSLKWGIISYGVYLGMKDPSTNKIHDVLKKIQSQPTQKVLPPPELLDSNVLGTIKKIANDSKKI